MTEVFKEIKGFEGRYEVSNLGNVKSLMTGNLMKLGTTPFGYLRVNLRYANCRKYKSYFVHRLVAETFLQNIDNKPQVNHIDCNKSNNKLENLEFCTQTENMISENTHNKTSLMVDLFDINEKFIRTYSSIGRMCVDLNLQIPNVIKCLKGKRKSHKNYKFKYHKL